MSRGYELFISNVSIKTTWKAGVAHGREATLAEVRKVLKKARLSFEDWADEKGMDLSMDFFNQREDANPYTEPDTRLAYEIWCSAISSQQQ